MSNTDETFDDSEAPIPLRTQGDVQRALAKALRQVAKGTLETARGHCLIIGYGTLAKMMRETVADEVLRRLEAIEAKQAAPAEPVSPH